MGSGFTLKMDVLGSDALLKKLDRTQKSFENITFQTVIDTAQEVCDRAKMLAPVESGTLRDSIEVQVDHDSDGSYQVSVGSPLNYAPWIENGHFTRPGVNRRWVHPQPFLYPAFREQQSKYYSALKSNVSKLQNIPDISSPVEPSGDLSTIKVSTSKNSSRSVSKIKSVRGSKTRKIFEKKLNATKKRYKRIIKNYKKEIKYNYKIINRFSKKHSKVAIRILKRIFKTQRIKFIKRIKATHRQHQIQRHRNRIRFQRQVQRFARVQTKRIVRNIRKKRR